MDSHDPTLAACLDERTVPTLDVGDGHLTTCRSCQAILTEIERAAELLDEQSALDLTKAILGVTSGATPPVNNRILSYLRAWVSGPRFALEFSYALATLLLVCLSWFGGPSFQGPLTQIGDGLSHARVQAVVVEEAVRGTLIAGSEGVSRGAVFFSSRAEDFWNFFRGDKTQVIGETGVAQGRLRSARLHTPVLGPGTDPEVREAI